MQASRNNKHKAPKFIDMKLFIAALSLAITLGLWNLFSNDAVQVDKVVPTVVVDPPPQPPTGVAQDLPPMPTLVSVLNVDTSKASAAAPAANPVQPASSSVQPAQLRSVTIPTQTIIQNSAPVVQSAVVVVSSGGGGGGGGGGGKGGAPAPVTSTHSSRPK